MKKTYLFAIFSLLFLQISCFGMFDLYKKMTDNYSKQLIDAIQDQSFSAMTYEQQVRLLTDAFGDFSIKWETAYDYLERSIKILQATKGVDIGATIHKKQLQSIQDIQRMVVANIKLHQEKIGNVDKLQYYKKKDTFELEHSKTTQLVQKIIEGKQTNKTNELPHIIGNGIKEAAHAQNISALYELLDIANKQELMLDPNVYILAQDTRTLITKKLLLQEKKLKAETELLAKQLEECRKVNEACNSETLGKSIHLKYSPEVTIDSSD